MLYNLNIQNLGSMNLDKIFKKIDAISNEISDENAKKELKGVLNDLYIEQRKLQEIKNLVKYVLNKL